VPPGVHAPVSPFPPPPLRNWSQMCQNRLQWKRSQFMVKSMTPAEGVCYFLLTWCRALVSIRIFEYSRGRIRIPALVIFDSRRKSGPSQALITYYSLPQSQYCSATRLCVRPLPLKLERSPISGQEARWTQHAPSRDP